MNKYKLTIQFVGGGTCSTITRDAQSLDKIQAALFNYRNRSFLNRAPATIYISGTPGVLAALESVAFASIQVESK